MRQLVAQEWEEHRIHVLIIIIILFLSQTHGPYHKGNRITQEHKTG